MARLVGVLMALLAGFLLVDGDPHDAHTHSAPLTAAIAIGNLTEAAAARTVGSPLRRNAIRPAPGTAADTALVRGADPGCPDVAVDLAASGTCAEQQQRHHRQFRPCYLLRVRAPVVSGAVAVAELPAWRPEPTAAVSCASTPAHHPEGESQHVRHSAPYLQVIRR
ncbi:hypothetical protein C3Y87_13785 [Carbonactinospora thermoautotrophica]|uniref:hypothetical protein n=1 Tax=Carbonactinospora thermoautotrophica TaxID=1469144 RepID=UPI00226D97EF|nr:hypothetical protein [Carbonactinospora thermoautotrophica]MCX9192464.1 hypothetical protein [Carbonactinospora thermoautotrophica]